MRYYNNNFSKKIVSASSFLTPERLPPPTESPTKHRCRMQSVLADHYTDWKRRWHGSHEPVADLDFSNRESPGGNHRLSWWGPGPLPSLRTATAMNWGWTCGIIESVRPSYVNDERCSRHSLEGHSLQLLHFCKTTPHCSCIQEMDCHILPPVKRANLQNVTIHITSFFHRSRTMTRTCELWLIEKVSYVAINWMTIDVY